MAQQFAVLHIQKNGKQVVALGNHIDRTHIPENADPQKTKLNRVLVDHQHNLEKTIEGRIKQGYTGKVTIRKDAVKSISLILSGSQDRMKEIEKEELLPAWVQVNQKWLEAKYGKENIVSLALHLDETTPHLHAVIVPLTADGRLNAAEVVGNRKKLTETQDEYAQTMKNFHLERGVKGSRANHVTTAEYYKELNKKQYHVTPPELDAPPLINRDKWLETQQEKINQVVNSLQEENRSLRVEIELKNKRTSEQRTENKLLQDELKKAKDINGKLKDEVLKWRTGERTLEQYKRELAKISRFIDDKGYIQSKVPPEQKNGNNVKIEPQIRPKPGGYKL